MYISDATSTSFFQISFEMSETVIILSKASSSILRSSFSTITLNFSGILACIILNRSDIACSKTCNDSYYFSIFSSFACLLESKKELMIINENPNIIKITEKIFGGFARNIKKNAIMGII